MAPCGQVPLAARPRRHKPGGRTPRCTDRWLSAARRGWRLCGELREAGGKHPRDQESEVYSVKRHGCDGGDSMEGFRPPGFTRLPPELPALYLHCTTSRSCGAAPPPPCLPPAAG